MTTALTLSGSQAEPVPGGLLVRPARLPDEGPCGYRMRLAEENLLSYKQTLQLEETSAIAIPPSDCAPAPLGDRMQLTRWSRWCPSCLAKRGMWLDSWELPLADACPECGNWLVDLCNACGQPVSWYRDGLLHCPCGAGLATGSGTPAPGALVTLSRTLQRLARQEAVEGIPVLSGASIESCVHVCTLIAALANGSPYRKLRSASMIQLLSQSWNTSTVAAEVLCNWPNAMIDTLSRWQQRCVESERGSLSKVFGNLYLALFNSLKGPEFEFMRVALGSYIAERWTGTLARRNRRFYVSLPERLPWVPAACAATVLGVSRRQVARLVAEGRLVGELRVTPRGRRFVVVNRDSLEREAPGLRQGLTLEEAAKRLGLPHDRLARILPSVCPLARQPPEEGYPWSIPETWVAGMNEAVMRAPLITPREIKHTESFEDLLRYKFCNDRQVAAFVNAVGADQIKPLWRCDESATLGGLRFEYEAASDAIFWHVKQTRWISIRNAASLLRVKQQVAYSIARSGLLKTRSVRIGRRREAFTTETWLNAFRRDYMFGRDFAEQIGKSPKATASYLRDQGVAAVSGPGIDGCRQLLYKKASLDQFNACTAPTKLPARVQSMP